MTNIYVLHTIELFINNWQEMMERFHVMLPQLNPFSLMNIAIGIENQLVGQHRADSIVIPRDKQVISPQTYI
jgi:hypothetical protein